MKRNLIFMLLMIIMVAAAVVGCANNGVPPETSNDNSTLQEPSNSEAAMPEANNESAEKENGNLPTPEQGVIGNTSIEQGTENVDNMQQVISGDFAIRNIETGKNLRPYNAGTSDGNDIILYPHNEWKCLTWQFNHVEDSIYQLQNVYTRKTFEPKSTLEAGVALWQQPLNDDSPQWEFIKQQDGVYAIRMEGTELYITISYDKTDSPIILMPYENSNEQQWELIEQYPKF